MWAPSPLPPPTYSGTVGDIISALSSHSAKFISATSIVGHHAVGAIANGATIASSTAGAAGMRNPRALASIVSARGASSTIVAPSIAGTGSMAFQILSRHPREGT